MKTEGKWILGSDYGVFSLNRIVSIYSDNLVSENYSVLLEKAKDHREYLPDVEHTLVHYIKYYRFVLRIVIKNRESNTEDKEKDRLFSLYGAEMKNIIPFLADVYSDNKEVVDALKNFSNQIEKIEADLGTDTRRLYNIDGIIRKLLQLLQGSKEFPHTLLNDSNKIVSSSSFRRLQDKAQVFPLEEHDYARTRLTHTMEVASIACEISDIISRKKPWENGKKYSKYLPQKQTGILLEKTTNNASLIHDMGNPPFGHYGEDIIRKYFRDNWGNFTTIIDEKKIHIKDVIPEEDSRYYDFVSFDGNAQSLRVMSKLQRYRKGHPLELSAGILGAVIKYPFNSAEGSPKGKMGYFWSEKDVISQLESFGAYREHYRNPCSLILEAADDISYIVSDLDDAVKKGVINKELFEIELKKINDNDDPALVKFRNDYWTYIDKSILEDVEEPFSYTMSLMSYEIKKRLIRQAAQSFCKNYEQIMDGVYYTGSKRKSGELRELLDDDCVVDKAFKAWISKIFVNYLYNNNEILREEIKGETIIKKLLDEFTKAVLAMDFVPENGTSKLSPKYEKIHKHEYKMFCLISDNYIENFYREYRNSADIAEKVYYKLKLAVDYVSGMTDSYAMECYQIIMGIK